jgi:NAD(P)-dependent dehydrogenase (short-subunit alcohol dehydrogenase family)
MMKVWFITGSSHGMGVEFAKTALESADSAVATSRSAESVTKALGSSDRLLAVPLDVTQAADAPKAVEAALKGFGRIDCASQQCRVRHRWSGRRIERRRRAGAVTNQRLRPD